MLIDLEDTCTKAIGAVTRFHSRCIVEVRHVKRFALFVTITTRFKYPLHQQQADYDRSSTLSHNLIGCNHQVSLAFKIFSLVASSSQLNSFVESHRSWAALPPISNTLKSVAPS